MYTPYIHSTYIYCDLLCMVVYVNMWRLNRSGYLLYVPSGWAKEVEGDTSHVLPSSVLSVLGLSLSEIVLFWQSV